MKNKKNLLKHLALLLGALSFAFAGLNWQIGIFAWLAPIGLLYYTRNSKKTGFILFFFVMMLVGYFSQSCNNIFSILVIGIVNSITFALFLSGTYIVDKILYSKGKGFYSTLIFPSVVVMFEWVISQKIGTWGIVAHSQYPFYTLLHFSSVAGVFSISFLVSWFGSIVFWLIENKFSRMAVRKSLLIYGSIFLVVLVYGSIRPSFLPKQTDTVKVATISGSTDIHGMVEDKYTEFMELMKNPNMELPDWIFADEAAINVQVDLSLEAAKAGAKIIVWSEDALILNHQQADALLVKAKNISKTYGAYLMLAFLEHPETKAEKPFNNKSIFITPQGEIAWEYLKSNLHPTAEVPIVNPGNSTIPFMDTEYGRIGNVICYDLDLPNFIKQARKNSIDIMLVPSYDWEKITPLHSNMASFEPIQSGFSIIRSNSAGLNTVRDAHGNLIAESNTFTSPSKILYADLPLHSVSTFYSKIGNVFVYLVLLFLLFMIGTKLTKKKTTLHRK